MNVEEYINTIHQQIDALSAKGAVVFHLCIHKRKLAVRESIHTRQTRCILLHTFTNEEVYKGCTPKTWGLIKEAILLSMGRFDNG